MKTNCPHCQEIIIVPVSCCRGDEALTKIYTPEQYEESLRKIEEEKIIQKEEQERYQATFVKFSAEYCKGKSFINEFLGVIILISGVVTILIVVISAVAITEISGRKISCDLILIPFAFGLLSMIFGLISIFIAQLKQNKLRKAFLLAHPEFANFNNKK